MAAGIGLALGVITGMPIGVVNVAIVDAATRGQHRFATGVGLGGALADAIHAALAFVGIGQLVAAHPAWSRAMAIAAAVIIIGYAATTLRRTQRAEPRSHGGGFATGLLITLPNPAALGAWITVAAVMWPTIAVAPAIALAIGVGVGSAAWFVMLARWIARLPPDGRAARVIPKVAVVLLVGIAVAGVVRALL